MRTIVFTIVLLAVLKAVGQQQPEIIRKEFQFPGSSSTNTLIVANINGSVEVEGHTSDKILVEVERNASAGAREPDNDSITVGYIELGDTLILYVDGLCSRFGKSAKNGNKKGGWGYDFDPCNDEGWKKNEGYNYRMNFKVRVPGKTNLILSTVNDGDLGVTGGEGSVIAENINGSITLDRIAGPTRATTINGNLDINYVRNPSVDCRYYTLNGDINANFPKGLAAVLSFKSFNGNFYTNVDDLKLLPVSVQETQNESGIRYKLGGNRYTVRNGGVNLNFETFNGNVYLREKEL